MKRNTLINRALTLALSVTLITTLSVPTITAFGADPTGDPTPTPTGELSDDPTDNLTSNLADNPSNTPSSAAHFEALVESLPNPTDVTPGDVDTAATASAAQEAYTQDDGSVYSAPSGYLESRTNRDLSTDAVPSYVADVSGIKCTSLADALVKATELIGKGQQPTIKLLASVVSGEDAKHIELPQGANVILDLNGHELVGVNAGVCLINRGTLTINDSSEPSTGKIYTTDVSAQGRSAVVNFGELVINGGTFSSAQSRGAAIENAGKATINGGSFTACDNYTNEGWAYAIINGSSKYPEATMEIVNATVFGNMNGALACNGGTITVQDGSYTLGDGVANASFHLAYISGAGVINIKGGTFTRNVQNEQAFFLNAGGSVGSINVSGGIFEDLVHDAIKLDSGSINISGGTFKDGLSAGTNAKVSVTGGTFAADPSPYVASGYTAVQSNGVWQINSPGSGAITWGEGFQEVSYQVELEDGNYSDLVVLNSGEAIKLPANYADNGDGEVFVDFRMKMKDGYLPTSWAKGISSIGVPFYSAEKGDFYIPLILDINNLQGITLKAEQAKAIAQLDTPYGALNAGVVDEWRTRLFASLTMASDYIGQSEPVGETLKLLANVDMGSTTFAVPSGVHLTFDMNGHNLTGSGNYVLAVTGTVKIDDTSGAALPGSIINSAKAGIVVETSTGSLTIDKVAVKSLGSGSRAVFVRDGGSFLMTGGRLEGSTGLRVINRIASVKSSATISGGEIVGASDGIFLLGNTASTKSAASEPWPVEVTVKEAAHIEASGGPAVTVTGNGSVLNVEGGMLTGGSGYGAISGNGKNDNIKNEGGTVINVSGGTIKGVTEYKSDGSVAYTGNGIYHPQIGVLNVTGGTITADTGIEMRGGTLNVQGGTITGTMTPTNVNSNGSGSTTDGVGISVAQHTTIPAIDVTISGGEINGFTAFYQSSPEAESDPSIVSVLITGGTFSTINDGTLAVYSENKTGFITGGTFSTNPPSEYLAQGYCVKEAGGLYQVVVEDPEASINGVGYMTLADAVAAAKSGDTVTLLKSVQDQEKIAINNGKVVTLDLNGHNIGFASNIGGLRNYFEVQGGALNLVGSGKVYEQGYYYAPVYMYGSEKDVANFSTVIVGENVELEGYYGLMIDDTNGSAYGAVADVFGTLSGKKDSLSWGGSGLYVNGNVAKETGNVPKITIEGSAKLSGEMGTDSENGVSNGLYLAGFADTTIKPGAQISGGTGIELRAGKLTVEGGTIVGTAQPTISKPNDNGSTSAGAGIAVVQHTTVLHLSAIILGGTIEGYTPLYQKTTEMGSDPSKVSLAVSGGTFMATNGGDAAVYSENKTDFITGGTFSSLLDTAYYDESMYKQNALDAAVEPGKVVPLVVNPPAPGPGTDPTPDPEPEPEPEKPIIKVEVPPTPDEGHYVTIPETTVEKATEHVQNVLDTIVAGEVPAGMSEEQANEIAAVLDKAQSPEEIEIVLSLQAEPKDAHEVDSTEREAVEGVSGEGEEPTVFFDLSVLMTVKVKGGGGARETTVKLSAVDEPLLFEIHVDPELIRGKNVRIAHVHDGITEVYNPESVDREEGIVRLHAAKFSTYALLTSTSCTVSFESNGGTPVKEQGIPFGGTVVRPTDPTRDGFVFAGWFTDEGLTAPYDFAKPVDKSFVLYAKWTPVTDEPGQDPSGTPGQDPNQTPGGNTNQPTRLDTPGATKDSPLTRLLSTGEGPAVTFALVAAVAALVSALVVASALRRRRTH